MNSMLYVIRMIKELSKNKKYLIIYGAGNIASKCRNLLTNCHVQPDYYMVTDISRENGKNQIEGIPIKDIGDYPFKQDMTPGNTGIIIAVSPCYTDDIRLELKKIGIQDSFVFPEEIKGEKRPYVAITTREGCSVACEYCPQKLFVGNYEKRENPEKMLSLEQFKSCLHNIPGQVQINFAGFSEPFLNPQCSEMIQYAFEQGYYIETYTCLMGLSEDIIDKVFFKTKFILHLPDEKNQTNIIINEEYIRCLTKLFELNKKKKQILRISAPMGINKKLLPYISKDIELLVGVINRAGALEDISGSKTSGCIACEMTYNRLDKNIMLPNGDVVLCCNDWGLKNILGNLREQTWADIVDGRAANSIREDMLMGKKELICHSCNFAIALID